MLKQDHRKVEGLFSRFEKAGPDQKARIVDEVCRELIIHSEIEEKLFYPASRQPSTEDLLDEAQVEHDAAKVMILELMDGDPSNRFRDAKFKVLADEIKQHIKEEEAPDGVLAKAQRAGVNTRELAERMTQLKRQLQQKAEADRLPEPRPVSFQLFGESYGKESRMPTHRDEYGRFTDDDDRGYRPRGSNDRDRDERGRFTSDDDDRRYQSRGSYDRDRDERGRFTSDDDDRGYRSRDSYERDRDERGRFTSDDDDRGYRSRGSYDRDRDERGRFMSDDDDERSYRSRGRGRGGWYGDPEGHSEASQRGWDDREGNGRSRSYRDDDDDRGYRSRGSGRGWYGDREAHSEAARRGWYEREGPNRGESRSYAARGRDDDNDRSRNSRGSRDRGHGGWFGDREGHSEAARRGWEDRR